MTMFLSDYLSIDAPLKSPGPDIGPVCFSFDAKWVPYIISCLRALTLNGCWADNQHDSMGQAANLIGVFMGVGDCGNNAPDTGAGSGDCMGCCIRMRNGVLEVFECGEWKAVDGWDLSSVVPAQPGHGAPQPKPGECQSYTGIISPTGSWLLPTPVNSGDVVTVSNLNGAWSPTAFTEIWDCPDGNLYFAGGCIDGTAAFDAGAPMPTAPLNGTILYDGTNYYDVSAAARAGTPAAITILPGIVNKQLVVRCNFHGGVEPSGEVSFDIQVCNNVVPSWHHDINFTITPGGFSAFHQVAPSEDESVYIPGSGWTEAHISDSGAPSVMRYGRNVLHYNWTTMTNISRVQISYDSNRNGEANNENDTIDYGDTGGLHVLLDNGTPGGTNLSALWTGSQDMNELLILLCSTDAGGGVTSGTTSRLFRLTVEGTGFDPWSAF
jgi:hypothetical protein